MSEPVAYQPDLGLWARTWRLLLIVSLSVLVCFEYYGLLWSRGHYLWLTLDFVAGLVALAVVHFRRRYPFLVVVATFALASFSGAAAGSSVLALVSLATRRNYVQIGAAVVLSIATAELFYRVVPTLDTTSQVFNLVSNVTASIALAVWGMYVGSRRELLWTLRSRAERAEAEQDLRAGKARAEERARIAREMHDVLAHRISQVSMHAGALSFREDLDAASLRAGIGEVQARANEALADLRGVLGVLRDPLTGEIAQRPQPTYADLHQLIADAQAAEVRVHLTDDLDVTDGPPMPGIGRTLYRLVQEGITNAHKHAAGALLTITLTGNEVDGIALRMSNPFGFAPAGAPGAGLGLVGLTERVEVAGGSISHGRVEGSFVVEVWLPWGP